MWFGRGRNLEKANCTTLGPPEKVIYEDEQAGCTQNIVTHKQRIRQLFERVL